MRYAYADPPYLGLCGIYDHFHGDDGLCWDRERTHSLLIDRLVDEYPDGWALSLHTPSLRTILALCPENVRVAAWVKPFASFKPGVNPGYCWEPVIFHGGRRRTDKTSSPSATSWPSRSPCGAASPERSPSGSADGSVTFSATATAKTSSSTCSPGAALWGASWPKKGCHCDGALRRLSGQWWCVVKGFYPYADGAYGPLERLDGSCCDPDNHRRGHTCGCPEHPPSKQHPQGRDTPDRVAAGRPGGG